MSFACLYIPDFEAWVFQRAEGFRGPLVSVASGLVAAANKLARRAGIESGITEARAKALCPDVAIRLRDYGLENAVWDDTLARIHTTTPFLEYSAPPFAWLKPVNATSLRALVRGLGAQAGVAPHRSFAQLAAMRAAPGNTLVLQKRYFKSFLDYFGVERLAALGFEEEMLEQLELLGYDTLGSASNLSRRHLNAQFGQDGERLFGLIHPDNAPSIPLFTPDPVVEHAYECDPPCSEPGEVWPVIEHLVELACETLGGRRCQRVTLALQDAGESELRRRSRILATPLYKRSSLLNTSRLLMNTVLCSGTDIERISLTLGSLSHPVPRQQVLFHERPSIYTAVRAVNKRFPGMLKRAMLRAGTLFLDESIVFEPFPESPAGERSSPGGSRKHTVRHEDHQGTRRSGR